MKNLVDFYILPGAYLKIFCIARKTINCYKQKSDLLYTNILTCLIKLTSIIII